MKDTFRKLRKKWGYSFSGLITAFKEEKSLWMQLFFGGILIGLGIWGQLSFLQWAIMIFMILLLLVIEILNTALEAAIDTIAFQYNIKVKKIKDIASSATLIMTIAVIIASSLILIPSIIEVMT